MEPMPATAGMVVQVVQEVPPVQVLSAALTAMAATVALAVQPVKAATADRASQVLTAPRSALPEHSDPMAVQVAMAASAATVAPVASASVREWLGCKVTVVTAEAVALAVTAA